MARPTEEIDFTTGERVAIVAAMDRLAPVGKGWINIEALVHGEDGWDTAEDGAEVLITWQAPRAKRRSPATRVEVGLQHKAFGRAGPRLTASGLTRMEGWRTLQDHARRGLVIAVPVAEDHDRTLEWLLSAADRLATDGLSGHWRAWIWDIP